MITGYRHFKGSTHLSEGEIAERICRHTSYQPHQVHLHDLIRSVETDKETGTSLFVCQVSFSITEDPPKLAA